MNYRGSHLNSKLRIALINPPFITALDIPSRDSIYKEEDLTIGLLAAVLRQHGHDTLILDCQLDNLNIDRTIGRLKSYQPDIVGLSIKFLSSNLIGGMLLAKAIRVQFKHLPIIVGGHTATLSFESILWETPGIDCIVLGEGENTLLDLIEHISARNSFDDVLGIAYCENGTIIKNPPRALIEDMDTLPFPERDYLHKSISYKSKAASIITSRGCPFDCAFCSVKSFYKQNHESKSWRGRSPENIVAEIEYLVKNYDIRFIGFPDDNFLGFRKEEREGRVSQFVNELNRKQIKITFSLTLRADSVNKDLLQTLKEVGLRSVNLGIESGCQSVLDRLNKKTTVEENQKALEIIKNLNLHCTTSYIMFDPFARIDEIKETIKFIKSAHWPEMRLDFTRFLNALVPYPGTPIKKTLKDAGLLRDVYIKLDYQDKGMPGFFYTTDYLELKTKALFHYISSPLTAILLKRKLQLSELQNRIIEMWPPVKKEQDVDSTNLIKFKNALSMIHQWNNSSAELVLSMLEHAINEIEQLSDTSEIRTHCDDILIDLRIQLYNYEKKLFGKSFDHITSEIRDFLESTAQ